MDATELFIRPGEMLLPRKDLDWTAWACVACDQFTSQPQYWEEAAMQVGDRPSALKLIVPECYLDEARARIPKVHENMRRYLSQGLLETGVRDGFILTERSTENGARLGLVVLMDLEGYDYRPGGATLIRPTEGTILERIPARMEVRRGAALEMSHVLLLIDDAQRSVVEPLYEKRGKLQKLYDFPLMMNGGRLAGYGVTGPTEIEGVMDALAELRFRLTGEDPLLYAVGDGNHSLAAAKACWEAIRPSLNPRERQTHPARFALVELENIHDDALRFEPIHRLVTGYDGGTLLEEWEAYKAAQGAEGKGTQEITCVWEGKEAAVCAAGSTPAQALVALQGFLDAWLPAHPEAKLDYVHGEDAVRELTTGEDAIGFLLPKPGKESLFATVRQEGVLPRKAFSMGEAHEKRYYLETRRLEG